ncbi:aminotransferase class I/II-fold pyridoxal phosphate-dependent enzyme [Streptomyces sp. NBC_00102]|uniref:aminotransferase class I/II-fold pyridoxal phosphate-dependent enzyme n=1 Tax=Streptomyces sp. NBC_00102 TaxID=2975652 RepID=UPI0022505B98|nr:aminotransferase class I/II-fold pyridoxal phosphate-dependent enzyme [Streptomyces sp. NBC_00102]MCX5402282.1 aminotransferase class V-fold PLP-dependent enzyme [Streptomyces sp. NBC_00102]
MLNQPFLVLEGPDGAGKTTLARKVAATLASRGVQYLSRRQVSTASAYAATLMRPMAQMLWHSGDATDLPDHFWAHLQSSWFTAHGEQVVAPALEDGPVIVDGWYYKLASKLAGQGWAEYEIDQLFAKVRTPDHVIMLRVEPEQLWERRSEDLRPAELGMHGAYPELGEESFLDYQGRGLERLVALSRRHGWTVLDVPAGEPEDETVQRLVSIIEDLLGVGGKGPEQIPAYTWPHVDHSLRDAVDRQLTRSLSDRDAGGVIGEFEARFADFVGARHAIAFSSGTAALHAMCVAAGLAEGDEIIAPAYTFFATATPFAYEGVKVVFADADRFGNLDPARLPELVTDRTRAVVVTHMWGIPCDMTAIAEFCTARGLLLLEDCSHAHFASWRGRRVGTYGHMAAFSTNQKAITTGEGGVLVTDDDRYRDLALLHGHYNKRCFKEIDPEQPYFPYALTGMGLKSRATTVGAAIGLDQLAKANAIEARRRDVADAFATVLKDNPVVSPVVVDPQDGQHGLYVMGLRYHHEAADVPIDVFVDRLTSAGADFDIPGSTAVVAGEPLFHRPARTAPWAASPVSVPVFPGAEAFIGSFFKTPLWGFPGDEAAVAHHLSVLARTAAEAAR